MATTILRLPEVLNRTGLSRTNVYRRVRAGTFPRPVELGPRARGWHESDINEWIEARPVASMAPSVTRPSAADAA